MTIVWILIGAAVAWFVFNFRATKTRMREMAGFEVTQFIRSIDAWNVDRNDFDRRAAAAHHFMIYDMRRTDFTNDPTGRSMPAQRALLASFWVNHLTGLNLLTIDGQQSRWCAEVSLFWDSIAALRNERDLLLANDHFAQGS